MLLRPLTFCALSALFLGLSVPAVAVTVPAQESDPVPPVETLASAHQSTYPTDAPALSFARDPFTIEELPAPMIARSGTLSVWPSTAPVNDGYGYRDGGEFHNGIDIMADYGSPLVAASAGVVTAVVEDASGWGQYVKIDHGNGVSTLYAHMISGSPTVVEGQTVEAGQVIGSTGDTGYVTFYHLHFEVYVDGSRVDPIAWLP